MYSTYLHYLIIFNDAIFNNNLVLFVPKPPYPTCRAGHWFKSFWNQSGRLGRLPLCSSMSLTVYQWINTLLNKLHFTNQNRQKEDEKIHTFVSKEDLIGGELRDVLYIYI